MANNQIATSGFSTRGGICGVFIDGNDNFYVVLLPFGGSNEPSVWKSSNNGVDWTRQDSAGETAAIFGIGDMAAVLDGDTIHIVVQTAERTSGMDTIFDVQYYQFHVSTHSTLADEWDGTRVAENIVTSQVVDVSHSHMTCDIAVRPDGNIVVVSRGPDVTSMGSDYRRAVFHYYNGSSWSLTNQNIYVPATENTHVHGARLGLTAHAQGDADVTNVVYEYSNDLVAKLISGADPPAMAPIAGATGLTVISGSAVGAPSSRPLCYADGSTDKVVCGLYHGSNEGEMTRWEEASSEAAATQESGGPVEVVYTVTGNGINTLYGVPIEHYVAAEEALFIYRESSTNDLMMHPIDLSGTNPAAGTEVTIDDTVTVSGVYGSCIYDDGGDTVLGIFWIANGGTFYFTDYVLEAAPAAVYRRRQLTTVRM